LKPIHNIKIICLVFFTFILTSCNKNEELGIEVHPGEIKINAAVKSDFSITAYSLLQDSVLCASVSSGTMYYTLYNLLGSYTDPIYGITTASIYSQFLLSNNNVNFGINPKLDSMVLCLAYGGYYGDTTYYQTARVYELSESIPLDTIYSNKTLTYNGIDYANFKFKPKVNDSITINGVTYPPHLRIPLKNTFAQKFINASGTIDLSDNTHFLEFFKGLYITTDKSLSGGVIPYFSMTNSVTGLYLYYHNDSVDSAQYQFIIDNNAKRFTNFNHYNYIGANTNFLAQINGDTSLGTELLYLQAMGGVKTKLKINNFAETFKGMGTIIINKAELIFTSNSNLSQGYVNPDRIILLQSSSNGKMYNLPDIALGDSYFGGYYNSTTGEYRFNISVYIQNLLKYPTNPDYGLYLVVNAASIQGSRVVLNGCNSASGKIRLEVTYTKI